MYMYVHQVYKKSNTTIIHLLTTTSQSIPLELHRIATLELKLPFLLMRISALCILLEV